MPVGMEKHTHTHTHTHTHDILLHTLVVYIGVLITDGEYLLVFKVAYDFEKVEHRRGQSLCLSVCVCVPHKRFLRNCWSPYDQTWHGNCLRKTILVMHHM